MGILQFKVEADYQEVVRLRAEVERLEKEMRSINSNDTLKMKGLEGQLAQARTKMQSMVSQAAMNGKELESAYAKMAKSGSAANGILTESASAASIFGSTIGGVNTAVGKLMNLMGGVGGAVGTAFGVTAISSFLNKVEQVRTQFQDIESTMKVFLGEEKAATFTSDLKDYAFYNMFEFSDLASASKQLIAYGNKAEDVIGILDKLSNIASGTGASLGEMVSMYNRSKSLGTVDSRMIQSWAAKGVVIKDELKEMGVAAEGSTVTFNQLNDVIDKLTTGEGRFAGLMLEQMNNLSAARGQLQDNLDAMYNEIGEKIQPLLKGVIDAESWLVDNYESLGKVILTVAASYGVYRTILAASNAIRTAETKILQDFVNANIRRVAVGEEGISQTERETNAIRRKNIELEREIRERRELIALEIAKSKANITRLEGIKAGSQDALAEATRDKDGKRIEALKKVISGEEKQLNDEKTRLSQLEKSAGAIDNFTDKLKSNEKQSLKNVLANSALAKSMKGLGALMTNPYFIATAAIIGMSIAIYKIVTADTAEEAAQKKVNEKMERYSSLMDKRKNDSDSYISVIKDTTASLYEQADAYEKLVELYPELKKFSKEDLQSMSIGEIKQARNNILDERQAEYIEQSYGAAKSAYERLQSQMANASESRVMDYGGYVDGLSRRVERAKAELQEWEKQREKYKDLLDEKASSNLQHNERKAILEGNAETAKMANDIMVEYQNAVNDIANDMELEKGQRLDAMFGTNEEMQEKVKSNIAALQQAIKEANDRGDKEEANRLEIKLKSQASLLGELQGIYDGLKSWLRRAATEDPLVISFMVENESDLGRKGNKIRRGYERSMRQIGDSNMTDEQKAQAADALISQTIGLLEDRYMEIDDTQNPTSKAIQEFIEQLKTGRNNGWNYVNTGIPEFGIGNLANETAAEVRSAGRKLNDEIKEYGTYAERMSVSTTELREKTKQYNETLRKYNAGEATQSELQTAKEAMDTARSNMQSLVKANNEYSQLRKAEREQLKKDSREKIDILFETKSAEIGQMKDGALKEMAQIKLSFKKREEEIERGYEDLKEKRMKDAESLWKSNPDNVGDFNEQAFLANFVYTPEDVAKHEAEVAENRVKYLQDIDDATSKYQTERQKKDDERRKVEEDIMAIEAEIAELSTDGNEEAVTMMRERLRLAKEIAKQTGFDQERNDFFKQYGTLEERKKAINEDYDNKIALERAGNNNTYKIQSLEKERQEALSKAELDDLSERINFAKALDEVGTSLSDLSAQTLKAAEAFMQSAEFAKMGAEEQKEYYEIVKELRQSQGYSFKDMFPGLSASADNVRAKESAYRIAQAAYGNLGENASDDERRFARLNLEQSEKELNEATDEYIEESVRSQGALGKFSEAIDGISSGSLLDFARGIDSLLAMAGVGEKDGVKASSALQGALGVSAPEVEAVIAAAGASVKMWDAFTGGAISDAMDSVKSGLTNFMRGIFDRNNLAYERLAEKIGRLTDALEKAREYLNEDFDDSYGKTAIETEEKIQENLAKQRASVYELAMKYEKTRDARKGHRKNGFKFDDYSELFSMSGEELKEFISENHDIYSKLTEEEKNFIQQLIDLEDESVEATDRLHEKLKGISKEDFTSNLIESLYDLDATTEQIADNMDANLFRAFLNTRLDEMGFVDEADELYDKYTNGEIDTEKFKQEYRALIDAGIDARDEIAELTGYANDYYKQEGSSRGFQAMSQGTEDVLEGRFSAMQVALEEVKAAAVPALLPLNTNITEMLGRQSQTYACIAQTQDMLAQSLVSIQSIDTNILWLREQMTKKQGVFADIEATAKNTKGLVR